MVEQIYLFAVRPCIVWRFGVGGNRAVVTDVQVEPDRVSPQDVAARMPAATANVRAFVDFSLGNVGHLFMVLDEDSA